MPQENQASGNRGPKDGLGPQAQQAYKELISRAPETKVEARLGAVQLVMDLLGNPQHSCPIIHVTGTNGKTSTARMIEAGLRAAGLRTGRFTSPHMTKFTERISIDGLPVTDGVFVRVWEEIKPYFGLVDARLEKSGQPPLTFFEALTVAAFAIFADAPVDVIVLEVGLGGITDATNVADATVAVLTPISLDHTDVLGDSVTDIAREKTGIIKPGSYVISSWQEEEAAEVIAAKIRELGSKTAWERRDFSVYGRRAAVGGQVVDVQGIAGDYREVFLPLHGEHQAQNLSVAVAALEVFFGGGSKPLGREVIDGMSGIITSPGRLEVIHTQPSVIVDAAHNPAGAQACAAAATEAFDFSGVIVLGVLEGKDSRGIIQTFQDVFGEKITAWCFTQSTSFRAVPAALLARDAVAWGVPENQVHVEQDLPAALRWAMTEAAGPEDAATQQAVLVAGSVTVAAQARLALGAKGLSEGMAVREFMVRDRLETSEMHGAMVAFFGEGRQEASVSGFRGKQDIGE